SAAPGHVEGVRRHVFDRLTPEQVTRLRDVCEAIAAPLMEAAGFDLEACPRHSRPHGNDGLTAT
ncbi:MAG TPA: hypothetical protein VFB50_08300, partial [Chloroflexota bacterium]|nr:hypothetical protein [Chloroflexota bacterium]